MFAIETSALTKTYGSVQALTGVDLEVEPGTVLGVLGPNGAGKTTAVGILSTLQSPTSGRALVGGHDVVTEAAAVRSKIGLTGQYAAVDEHLTGRENLTLFGRLLGMPRRQARTRSDELLGRFALEDAADRQAGGYSGGMRRRLDLAASLVGHPEIVFLDEPTTGLDPRSRIQLWDVVRDLVADGTTVLLTTQYLEEADELADRIVVIDAGQIVARGTSEELKEQIGGQVFSASLADAADLAAAATLLDNMGIVAEVDRTEIALNATVADAAAVSGVIKAFDTAGVVPKRLEVTSPSLDDVFLSITGGGNDDLAGIPAAA
jgi:daunorubicin resistance ABC transporter ATP-binding subunit